MNVYDAITATSLIILLCIFGSTYILLSTMSVLERHYKRRIRWTENKMVAISVFILMSMVNVSVWGVYTIWSNVL
jgi:hypothetical protein